MKHPLVWTKEFKALKKFKKIKYEYKFCQYNSETIQNFNVKDSKILVYIHNNNKKVTLLFQFVDCDEEIRHPHTFAGLREKEVRHAGR